MRRSYFSRVRAGVSTSFAFAFAFALALALASASCRGEEGSCESLQRQLARCGLPARDLDCARISRSDRESLVESIGRDGCPALAPKADGNVDSRVCTLGGWSCPASPLPESNGRAPRYPLVLVSGIDGSPTFDWNPRIVAALHEDDRIEAHVIHVLPWATIAERTADLFASLDAIARARGWSKANLICYAVGGLDCRYLASPHGIFEGDAQARARVRTLIASITTIATPHRGTHVADAALEALASGDAAAIFAALSGTGEVPASLDHGALAKTLQGLTPSALAAWSPRVTDDEQVFYQSFAGVSRVLGRSASDVDVRTHCRNEAGDELVYKHPGTSDATGELLWITTPFAGATLGPGGETIVSPSDGMIAVESAKWGEFRGCVPADHYDVIGQIGHATRDVMTGFDPVDFYRWIASDLAERGL